MKPLGCLVLLCFVAVAAAESPITYKLSRDGNVSLAIYGRDGRMVRTLLYGEPQQAGEHRLAWDGLDWTGRPADSAPYQWRLFQSPGLKSEFVMRIGTPFNHEEWPSNHDGPRRVAVLNNILYMMGGGECVPGMIAMDLATGKILETMGGHIGDMAAANGRLFSLGDQDGTLRVKSVADPDERTPSRNLVETLRRFRFDGAPADAKAGVRTAGIDAYDKARGCGWNDPQDLRLEGIPGSKPAFGYVAPERGKAGSDTLRAFLIDMPEGAYTVTVDLGIRGAKFDVCVDCGLKDGKPQLHFESLDGEKSFSYEAVANGGQLRIGLNNKAGASRAWFLRGISVTSKPTCVAACGPHLAVGFAGSGRVLWLAQEDFKTLAAAQVKDLRDIAVTPSGTVLALAGNEVVELTREPPGSAVRIRGLSGPKRIAVDEPSGDIFVVDNGGCGQIKRYGRDFRLLRTFGRAGGRQQGLYNPEDFFAVADIAADGQGGFVIVENWSAPRRTARFDAEGRVRNEWCGGQLFFTSSSPDPRDPRRVWMNSHWGWIMEAEADYEKKTWKPRATYEFNTLAGGLFRGGLITGWELRRHGDDRYLVNPGQSPKICTSTKPTTACCPWSAAARTPRASWSRRCVAEANAKVGRSDPKISGYMWQDANGDGVPQAEEIRLSTWRAGGGRWSVDDQFNYVCLDCRASENPPLYTLYRLPVKKWEGKRPVYPAFDEIEQVAQWQLSPRENPPHVAWSGPGILAGAAGDVRQVLKGGGEGYTTTYWTHTSHSGTWPANEIGTAALCRWSGGGLMWRAGTLASAGKRYRPGQLNCPERIIGRYQGRILVTHRIVQPLDAWTEDGLYAGSMFDRRAADGLPEACYTWHTGPSLTAGKSMNSPLQYDMLANTSFAPLPGGDVLFFGAGWNHVPVYRVSGWQDSSRQEGKVAWNGAAAAAAAEGRGLCAEFFSNATMSGRPVFTTLQGPLWFGGPETRNSLKWPDDKLAAGAFSIRLAGFLEPRFSERYLLKAYVGPGKTTTVKKHTEVTPPDRVRVWLDGRLVIDAWDDVPVNQTHHVSQPLALEAGRKVPIKIEYAKTDKGYLHLCWESTSQEIEHVPAAFLYPAEPAVVTYPAPRACRPPTITRWKSRAGRCSSTGPTCSTAARRSSPRSISPGRCTSP